MLIELLVYMALFSLAAFVMISSYTLLHDWSSLTRKQQHQELVRKLLMDIIVRDVAGASCRQQDWCAEHAVFKKESLNARNMPVSYDVGYACSNGSLMRIHGVFDYVARRWEKRSVAYITSGNISAITMALDSAENERSVVLCTVRLKMHGGVEQVFKVRPRSKRIAYAR